MSKKGGAKIPREAKTYEPRDIVLGKVRGYAPWPGMIVDPTSVPAHVTEERPSNKKTTFYCIRFFPTGDYSWLVEKDISKLQPHEIEAYISEPNKKSADLLEGYRIAKDPTKWIAERDALASQADEAEESAEVDQLNSEDEADASASTAGTKSRKRKRESDAASASVSKAKKAPKTKKEPVESASAKKKATSASGKGKKGGKSKAVVESEDEGEQVGADDAEDAGPSTKASPPPAKKPRRDKEDDGDEGKGNDPEALKVRDWRHKLQKSFLNTKATPKEEDMPALDELFKTVENYESMTIEKLQFSKIGKVMRHIAVLADEKVPRDSELKFRERSSALVQKWQQILNANKTNGSETGAAAASNANGTVPVPPGTADSAFTVAEATAALDLNGKGADVDAAADGEADAPGEAGDTSLLADVTMSDAI
ncbi:hypothetical protein FA15DRAFT_601847 [Coprinopsis marcescibilis]|uniref:PWWP domain-containing protein n=1 Tax=Coprinopsis marcescibilis TaxID=230819 RepID=A0A5C3KHE8_COPMA|nr:hypothetical protein FA15DRAFT_601847 [Coprinopsis marcescibilis]